jgi:hypothetical protein
MVRVRLRGFRAVDGRTMAAREALAFRDELVAALGGEADWREQRAREVPTRACGPTIGPGRKQLTSSWWAKRCRCPRARITPSDRTTRSQGGPSVPWAGLRCAQAQADACEPSGPPPEPRLRRPGSP